MKTEDLQRAVEYRELCDKMALQMARREKLEELLVNAVPQPLLGELLGLPEVEVSALVSAVRAREQRGFATATTLQNFKVSDV